MGMNIKNVKVERLAAQLSQINGETKTATILRALEEHSEKIARGTSGQPRLAQVLDFLEKEIWPNIPKRLLGRRVTKKQRERILGFGKGGV
jgi:hypothetical protein